MLTPLLVRNEPHQERHTEGGQLLGEKLLLIISVLMEWSEVDCRRGRDRRSLGRYGVSVEELRGTSSAMGASARKGSRQKKKIELEPN